MTAVVDAYAAERQRTILGHPRGLFVLFFAEMWERFSYYGMRALLIFYLTKHWLFDDGKANLIYGAYTSLVYITPVLGGYLADRYLGQRKAVAFGALLLTFGHCLMAVEGNGGQHDATINVFWLALSFIIVGSGFLKANISVIVGQLYALTDPRRDGAYTIFYMGINVGATLGTLVAGYLGEVYGWSYGFGAAGVGMLLGLIAFTIGRPLLLGQGEAPDPARLRAPVAGVRLEWLLYLVGVLSVILAWALIQYQDVIGSLLAVSGSILLGYVLVVAVFQIPYGSIAASPTGQFRAMAVGLGLMVLYFLGDAFGLGIAVAPLASGISLLGWLAIAGLVVVIAVSIIQGVNKESEVRDRIFAILFLVALNPVFWGLFEQAGGSLNLYTDRFVDRQGVPASLFQSINPIYIVLLGPIFAWLWLFLGKRGLEPSAPAKFGLALLQVGFSFILFVWGAAIAGPAATPVLFVFLIYLFQTTGELCLSPVGLSAMNRLAPKHLASLIMGAWFYMTAVGDFTAGKIGEMIGGGEGGEMTKQGTLDIYASIGWWTIGIGVVVLMLSPLIKRLMHLDTLRDESNLAGTEELAEPQAAGVKLPAERTA